MEEMLREFPERTAAVLRMLLDSQMDEHTIRRVEDGYRIECRCETSFEYDVVLHGATGLPEGGNEWYFGPVELRREGAGYALTGTIEDPRREEWIDVTLCFDRVDTKVWAIRADMDMIYGDPWMYLCSVAFGIVRKGTHFPWLLNDEERELMPMLRELTMLKHWAGAERYEFPILKRRFPPEIVSMLEKLEKAGEWKQISRCADRLGKKLRLMKYAPYWEELLREIRYSQLGYPDHDRKNSEIVRRITAYLHDRGYEGSYPDFRKRGTVGKTRWIAADGRYFRVRRGEPLYSYVRCRVSCFEGEVCVSFFSGAELTGPSEPRGAEHCCFRSDGKRFRSTAFYSFGPDGKGVDEKMALVVSKAELVPLSREQRKLEGKPSFFTVFFWTFLLGGVVSALFFTPAFALMSYFIGPIFGDTAGPGGFFVEFPWLQLFGGSWLLFGGALGAIFGFIMIE